MVYKDKDLKIHMEWVTLIPTEKRTDPKKFVGTLLIEEWNGKSKRAFYFGSDGKRQRIYPSGSSIVKKINFTRSYECFEIEHWGVITINGNSYPQYLGGERFCFTGSNEGGEGGGSGTGNNNVTEEEHNPDEYITYYIDCNGDLDGSATYNENCHTCMGGNTGITACPPTEQQLKEELKNKPFALFGDIDCETLKKWLSIAKFTPSQSIVNKLNSLTAQIPGYTSQMVGRIQNIDAASSSVVNMDYFSVTVTELPIINNERLTAGQFLHYIRTNLDSFTDGSKTFSAYNAYGIDDRDNWSSNNPIGSIVAIDLPGPDNGSVITSYSATDRWTFTTIFDPMYSTHPVSGNRDFGYTVNGNGSYTFYTRGVDRLTSWEGSAIQVIPDFFKEGSGIPFNAADDLWKSLQKGIKNFVISHAGASQINIPEIFRPNWDLVKEVIEGKKPLSTLSKDCPD